VDAADIEPSKMPRHSQAIGLRKFMRSARARQGRQRCTAGTIREYGASVQPLLGLPCGNLMLPACGYMYLDLREKQLLLMSVINMSKKCVANSGLVSL
jgi:hypothetical protein